MTEIEDWMLRVWNEEDHSNVRMSLRTIVRKVARALDHFYSQTIDGHVIRYLNGFVAAGIFDAPHDHLSDSVNTIWVFAVGYNGNGTNIIQQTNLAMTLDEAEDIHKALGVCIRKFKKIHRGEKKE